MINNAAGEEGLQSFLGGASVSSTVGGGGGSVASESSNGSSVTPHKSGHKRLGRHMSEIIKVEDAPPLPYNLKSKKRAARRVQSIHHLVERTPSEKELLDPETAAKEKKEKPPAMPRTHSISVSTNTFDDDMTTTNSESDNASHHSGVSSAASSTAMRQGSPLIRTKTMLVPCRLGNNPSSGLIRDDDSIKGNVLSFFFLFF
jgi:hypothetical protein